MIPCVILACKGTRARIAGQRCLMALGGRFGFHWTQNLMPRGGAVFTVTQAPEPAAQAVHRALAVHLQGEDYLVNGWRQRVSEEQMALAEAWWAGLPYKSAAVHAD